MSSTYTTNLNLEKPGNNDGGWDVPWRAVLDYLDALTPLGTLAVERTEVPSASLNVKVSAGSFRKADGTAVAYAGTASQAMTASSTNYVYLTDAGVLTVNTTGFPAGNIVPLATVVAGGSTITSVTDVREYAMSFGASVPAGTVTSVAIAAPGIFTVSGSPVTGSGTLTLALATQAANVVFAGPTTGSAAAPTFRALVVADLPTTGLIVNSSSGVITADTDGATITFNAGTSNKHKVTLGGARTLAVTGDVDGQELTVLLTQDGTGSRTVTWWAGILWPGGSAPTLTTTAGKTDAFRIFRLGSGSYLGFILGQNL